MANSFIACFWSGYSDWCRCILRQIIFGCFLSLGLAPFVLLLCCFGDETQVWLGDLRVVLVCVFAVLCDDLPFYRYWPIALCTPFFFTAYVVIRTVPQSIYGQTRGKKVGSCTSTPLCVRCWCSALPHWGIPVMIQDPIGRLLRHSSTPLVLVCSFSLSCAASRLLSPLFVVLLFSCVCVFVLPLLFSLFGWLLCCLMWLLHAWYFGLPCWAHPGAVPFPRLRTYSVSRCLRSPKRRQPAEASNTRPLMSLSNVACKGSHMRYFGGLVTIVATERCQNVEIFNDMTTRWTIFLLHVIRCGWLVRQQLTVSSLWLWWCWR